MALRFLHRFDSGVAITYDQRVLMWRASRGGDVIAEVPAEAMAGTICPAELWYAELEHLLVLDAEKRAFIARDDTSHLAWI